MDKGSHGRCSVKKDILKIFAKFAGKHLCQSLFFNKVAGLVKRRKLNVHKITSQVQGAKFHTICLNLFASNTTNCFINGNTFSTIFPMEFHLYFRYWRLNIWLEVQLDSLNITRLWENSLWYDSNKLTWVCHFMCGLFYVLKFPKCSLFVPFNKPIQVVLKTVEQPTLCFQCWRTTISVEVTVLQISKKVCCHWYWLPRFSTICTILKNEKQPWRRVVTFRQVALKVTLLHGCFSRFLNSTNDTNRAKHQICSSTTGIVS